MSKKVDAVFEKWQQKIKAGEEFDFVAFEGEMKNAMRNQNYHLVSIRVEKYAKKNLYTDVCYAYVKADSERFNDPGAIELSPVRESAGYKEWLKK